MDEIQVMKNKVAEKDEELKHIMAHSESKEVERR